MKGEEKMAYKAFNPDLSCQGKQYRENTTFKENGTEICKKRRYALLREPV